MCWSTLAGKGNVTVEAPGQWDAANPCQDWSEFAGFPVLLLKPNFGDIQVLWGAKSLVPRTRETLKRISGSATWQVFTSLVNPIFSNCFLGYPEPWTCFSLLRKKKFHPVPLQHWLAKLSWEKFLWRMLWTGGYHKGDRARVRLCSTQQWGLVWKMDQITPNSTKHFGIRLWFWFGL